jgi:hypothetical protein
MSVSNKKIRELESAAIDAAHAIDELVELLEGGGSTFLRDRRIANRVERLRLAAIELDRAETACSRERTLTMSEEEMREEFEALGLDWDETTERGHALLQRLLGEHDARREAEIAKKAGELAAGMGVGIEDAQDKVRMGESVELGDGYVIRRGFKLPDAPAEPQPRGVRRVDPQLLDLPIGHQPGGLGGGGKSELSYWYDLIEKVQPDPDWAEAMSLAQASSAREHVDVPPDPSGEAVVRLDDAAITSLLAAEIARDFDLDLAALADLPRATLLRLRADLEKVRKMTSEAKSPAEISEVIRRQYEQTFGAMAPLGYRDIYKVTDEGRLATELGGELTVLDVPPDTSETMVSAPLNAGPSLVYKPLALGPGGDFNRVEIPDTGWRAQALEVGVVAGAPIQIILGEIEPGGDVSLVTIIGFIETQVGAFWVSDHAVKWLRGPDGDAGPVSADLLPEKDVDRGRFSLTAQQDAALSQHFEDSAPLDIETLAQAEQRAAEARWGRLR